MGNHRKAPFRSLPWLFLVLPLLSWENARASDIPDFGGALQRLVFDTLGRERALADTSFAAAVIRKHGGELVREEAVAPDQLIYPASSIKTLIAFAALRRVDQGAITLETPVTIQQPNADAECPEWSCAKYGNGRQVTVRQLLRDMITVSNNLAANQLIDVASKDLINATADLLNASALRVFRKVYATVDPEPGITRRNTASARGLIELYREIATGRLGALSEGSRAVLIDDLGNQKINDRLNARFPAAVRFFHKTGSTSVSSSDAGFFARGEDETVILVGLQNFRDFEALRKIGAGAYPLLK